MMLTTRTLVEFMAKGGRCLRPYFMALGFRLITTCGQELSIPWRHPKLIPRFHLCQVEWNLFHMATPDDCFLFPPPL